MDILLIAQKAADRAYAEADTPEESFDAYLSTFKATYERGQRAEQILASGGVHEVIGAPTAFVVDSQNGNGTYAVDVDAGTCECPDAEYGPEGVPCKHEQAARIYAHENPVEVEPGSFNDLPRSPMAPDYDALGRERLPMTVGAEGREAAWEVAVQ